MKRIYQYIIMYMLAVMLSAGCSDFDAINTNPDAPLTATPGMLATGQIKNAVGRSDSKGYFRDHMFTKHVGWGESADKQEQYNVIGRQGFGVYTNLTNCLKMVELAADIDRDAYQGLALFLKAYELFDLSMAVGDIPYSEAFRSDEGITKPGYDTQKEVMMQILDDLDAAYTHFSSAGRSFEGDFIYNGDPGKWKVATSAFQLKVLISLSKKESDADLNIRKRFADIVNSRPLMTSNGDNFQIIYGTQSSQIYPVHSTKNNFTQYTVLSPTVIDSFKVNNDYRLFYLAQPTQVNTAAGMTADDWDAYEGVDPTLSDSEFNYLFGSGNFSNLNPRFYEVETGQPSINVGYAEQNFILSEACLRGWITGSAQEYFTKGVDASIRFTVAYTPAGYYPVERQMTDDWISSFLASAPMQLSTAPGNFEADLNKIITQKYLDRFMHDTWTSFYEYRRTGYPRIPVNPATNLNTMSDRMPVRWMYDQREYDYNRDNVVEAVQRQFNGNDDVNELMWILK
ncbi:MAG: SusD/RagB family nutrient-binding outer membrane lipoprotein [Tannerella sp.]|nr:SusD/RagB family nutrient-binding outer membrane lipoprotein [Tannerella sp.]